MENWKKIDGHSKYAVSDFGNIRNIETGEFIKKHPHSKGYEMVYFDGGSFLVHRLVCSAFVSNPDGKTCCDHIDGCKTNNAASNLRWVDYHENNSNPATSYKNARNETAIERTGKVFDIFIKSYPSITKIC